MANRDFAVEKVLNGDQTIYNFLYDNLELHGFSNAPLSLTLEEEKDRSDYINGTYKTFIITRKEYILFSKLVALKNRFTRINKNAYPHKALCLKIIDRSIIVNHSPIARGGTLDEVIANARSFLIKEHNQNQYGELCSICFKTMATFKFKEFIHSSKSFNVCNHCIIL